MRLGLFGGFYPFNPTLGQRMQSNAEGRVVDAAYTAHLQYTATEAVVASNNGVLAAFATSTLPTEKTTGFTQPTCAKNITATAGGTAGDIKAVQVVIEGLNEAGQVITETLPAFTVDTVGTVVGNKAFKSITKVTVPGMDGAGATVSIGYGEKLGIPYQLPHNTVLMALLNHTKESTPPTVAVSATALESNTIDLNSALNGTVVDVYLIV